MARISFMLTEQQQDFATENHNLIYDFIHKRGLDIDEWYGEMAEAYCRAVAKFDQDRGASFTTFAFFVMNNALKQGHIARIAEARRANLGAISMDETIRDTTLTLSEIAQKPVNEEISIIDKIDLENAMSALKPKERDLLNEHIQGYGQQEIAKAHGCSHQAIGKRIRKVRGKLAEALR